MSLDLGDTQIVIFEIPYGIRIEDGFSFVKSDENPKLELPLGNDVTEIECAVNGYLASLRFEKMINKENMFFGGQFDIEGERLGNTLSSHVLIHFSDQFMDNIPKTVISETPENYHEKGTIIGSSISPELDKFLIKSSIKYLNRFLQIYRYSENTPWIKPLTPQMIQDFYLIRYKNEELDRWRKRTWTEGPIRGGKANIDFIQSVAKSRDTIPLVHRLRLDAVDNIRRTNYQIGVIQSAQLFELWVIQAFLLVAKSKGIDESAANSLITRDDNSEYRSTYNIIEKFDSELQSGFNIQSAIESEDKTELSRWWWNTKKPRDRVIHRGYEPERGEASNAFKGAMEAILTIQSEFETELKSEVIKELFDKELPGSNILIRRSENTSNGSAFDQLEVLETNSTTPEGDNS